MREALLSSTSLSPLGNSAPALETPEAREPSSTEIEVAKFREAFRSAYWRGYGLEINERNLTVMVDQILTQKVSADEFQRLQEIFWVD